MVEPLRYNLVELETLNLALIGSQPKICEDPFLFFFFFTLFCLIFLFVCFCFGILGVFYGFV